MSVLRGTTCFYRAFSSARSSTVLTGDSFGSLHRSDVRVERLVRPNNEKVDFDAPPPSRKIKSLAVPLSLSKKQREQLEKQQSREAPPSPHQCFIECSRPEFNLLEPKSGVRSPLCSQYWVKNKYSDEWFIIKRRTKEPSSRFVVWDNAWDHYVPDRLHPSVREVLQELSVKVPTQIQSQCLQVFPSKYHLFIAAETGSGKTIAYGAPLITKILQQKRKGIKERAVVLAVTSSLKEQTFSVLSKLASRTDLTVSICGLGKDIPSDWDVLVGTPGLVEKYMRQKEIGSEVMHLILDEADMILDESFTEVLTEVFALIPIANSVTNSQDSGARVIFCSATCPEELECLADGVVERQFLRYIKSPNLHSLLPNVDLKFIRVREKDKISTLESLLSQDLKRGELNQTMVFCKDRDTAHFVYKELNSFGEIVTEWNPSCTDDDEKARIFVATDGAARFANVFMHHTTFLSDCSHHFLTCSLPLTERSLSLLTREVSELPPTILNETYMVL
ncbi:unnamed protein product [Nippostrongylus brasiliensis]|uniref:ATP-dependent RNA helicase n=1 Tax=Nippostrongylus brasiliensis TaxID=27835 RepID=A0A0N4YQW3_NIPBR|nr:unnamed protein product [Nippostrongylus brasiliensis]